MAVALPAGLSPASVETFGGLNIAADQEELGFGGAIDLSNVEFEPGRVRSRYGTSLFLTAAANIILLAPFKSLVSGRYLVVASTGASSNVAAYRYDASIVGSAGTLAGTPSLSTPVSSAHVGTPSANYLYVSTNQTTMARFDGGTWTNPTMPRGNVLAVTPGDNRLVVGAISGATSRVQFSDGADSAATNPQETFGANNFVDLDPGDGEQVMDMVTWGNQLYVFKRSKFFVFYGTSPDAQGQPVFNYRSVETGLGCMSWHCACAGRDGVYFLDQTGVYRTTGSAPVKISGPLDPFFAAGKAQFLGGATLQPTRGAHLSYVKDRLYVQLEYGADQGRLVFVYDPRLEAWSVWTPPGPVPLTGRVPVSEIQATSSDNAGTSMVMGAGTGVYRVDPSLDADNGVSFSAYYQSGFSDLGEPAREKTVRETEVIGTGTLQLDWARDFQSPVAFVALTANLITNPSFETNTTGWSTAGGLSHTITGGTLTRDTGQHSVGSASGKMVAVAAYQGPLWALSGTFVAGVVYQLTVAVKGNAGGEALRIFFGDAISGDVAVLTPTATTGWQTFQLSWTPTANRTTAGVSVVCTSGAATFFIDAIAVAQWGSLLTYVDGDSTNYQWSGTAHASTTLGPYPLLQLGSSPSRGLDRRSRPGELLSFKLSGVSGEGFSVDRVVPMVHCVRGVGEKT